MSTGMNGSNLPLVNLILQAVFLVLWIAGAIFQTLINRHQIKLNKAFNIALKAINERLNLRKL